MLRSCLLQATVSAVTDKLQQQDVEGAGHALSAALVTGTVIGCIILVAFQVSRQHGGALRCLALCCGCCGYVLSLCCCGFCKAQLYGRRCSRGS